MLTNIWRIYELRKMINQWFGQIIQFPHDFTFYKEWLPVKTAKKKTHGWRNTYFLVFHQPVAKKDILLSKCQCFSPSWSCPFISPSLLLVIPMLLPASHSKKLIKLNITQPSEVLAAAKCWFWSSNNDIYIYVYINGDSLWGYIINHWM